MKIVLIIIGLVGIYFVYSYFNEKHMEEVKLKRTQELKQMDPLEFNRSLYKVRAARQRLRDQLGGGDNKNIELKFNMPVNPEAVKTREELKDLKKDEPSIPTNAENPDRYIYQDDVQDQQEQNVPVYDNQNQQGENQ